MLTRGLEVLSKAQSVLGCPAAPFDEAGRSVKIGRPVSPYLAGHGDAQHRCCWSLASGEPCGDGDVPFFDSFEASCTSLGNIMAQAWSMCFRTAEGLHCHSFMFLIGCWQLDLRTLSVMGISISLQGLEVRTQ